MMASTAMSTSATAAPPTPTEIATNKSQSSSYNPISTLERQAQTNRILFFVRTNANCCLPGGVEYVLKHSTSNRSKNMQLEATSPTNTTADAQDTPNAITTSNNRTDPFGFLQDEDDTSAATGTATSNSNMTTTKKGPNLGRFLKKVAKSTTQSLERGMHHLAVKADQGRNPDQLSAGLYDATTDQLLSMTEAVPMRTDGLAFVVPLVGSTMLSRAAATTATSTTTTTTTFTLKLWIKSGAALLQQTKVAKNYFLGATQVTFNNSCFQNKQPIFLPDLELQSNLVVDGRISLWALPDTKHPTLCGRAWSLTDPDQQHYNNTGTAHHKPLFHLPLEQSYGFSFAAATAAGTTDHHNWLVATERATESTVVLPIATAIAELASRAAQISSQHASTTAAKVTASRHDVLPQPGSCCQVHVDIMGGLQWSTHAATAGVSFTTIQQASVQLVWQRPDSIFEVDLMSAKGMLQVPVAMQMPAAEYPLQSVEFYPSPCQTDLLPAVWQAHGGKLPPHGYCLGNIRVVVLVPRQQQVEVQNPFAPSNSSSSTESGAGGTTAANTYEVWDCVLSLDALVGQEQQQQPVVRPYAITNAAGQQVATIPLKIQLTPPATGCPPTPPATTAMGGLVALMGLPRLVEHLQPALDYEQDSSNPSNNSSPDEQRRRQQLATMGVFVTHAYMEQHVQVYRNPEVELWAARAQQYRAALMEPPSTMEEPHQDRTPRAFRPSSSRMEQILAGIGFNVHVVTLGVNVWDPASGAKEPKLGAEFQNITHGAPCDHFRGFSNIFPKSKEEAASSGHGGSGSSNINAAGTTVNSTMGQLGPSPVGPVTGGLRRLEAKRYELAALVSNLQTTLTMAIANFFVEQRQVTRKALYHVPPRHPELASLRWQLFEAVQSLHHVTWICATRRAAAFSQALGIALSSYLTSLSDPNKWQSTWPDLWARHGYLVCFEGLLSAAGKELGMIEDASVGISMLSMVQVVLVADNGSNTAPASDTVPVPGSPYLKWIRVVPSGAHPEVNYTVHVGMVQSYYNQRIPASLKNATPVRLYPLLFEVGVDIRQWGAHAGSNMYSSLQSNVNKSNVNAEAKPAKEVSSGGLIDDEDDDVGIADDDVLVQLNSEAFQKLNSYAHAISPANSQASMGVQKTHPMLETLYQHIVSSAGRINHDIVDEAATLAQQLGGGGCVFCKSGKDRTAMHVTYKQSQFVTRFCQRHPVSSGDGAGVLEDDPVTTLARVLADATTMRVRGTRLPICEKNVGQAKYAFNSLQVKFMPEKLKPPMGTLAGFLKGGKVFTGGGIES